MWSGDVQCFVEECFVGVHVQGYVYVLQFKEELLWALIILNLSDLVAWKMCVSNGNAYILNHKFCLWVKDKYWY